jgi:hypothetical protein
MCGLGNTVVFLLDRKLLFCFFCSAAVVVVEVAPVLNRFEREKPLLPSCNCVVVGRPVEAAAAVALFKGDDRPIENASELVGKWINKNTVPSRRIVIIIIIMVVALLYDAARLTTVP